MSKNLLDNGTVLTLGLVGAVAAAGALASRGQRGSLSRYRVQGGMLREVPTFAVGDVVTFDAGGGVTRIVTVTARDEDEMRAPYFLGRDENGTLRSGEDRKIISVARGSHARGSRSTGPTDAELRAVGRYTKSVDPDQKRYAREAGHGTGDLAIGKYVYSHYDEDSFADLLDHVREQGMVKTGKGSR
jgi:hypothetical protein